jgi:hypothetical protein
MWVELISSMVHGRAHEGLTVVNSMRCFTVLHALSQRHGRGGLDTHVDTGKCQQSIEGVISCVIDITSMHLGVVSTP